MRPWQQIPCIRFCPDGELVVEFRYPGEEVEHWVEFNERRRPECGLVVSDVVRSLGAWADTETMAAALAKRKVNTKAPTP